VTLQENNAIAVLDVEGRRFTGLAALGFKHHNLPANAIDASDRDGGINIASWPVLGMYQPDAIDTLTYHGRTFLFTANEGDARPAEETRVGSEILDPTAFPNARFLQLDANLGRLRITNLRGDTDGDGDFDELYAFGGRSFSIWNALGQLVFDSRDAFERVTASAIPSIFNSNGSPATFDTRSDDKGPEPEGIVLGKAFGRTYAFIGLERTGGIIIFDVSNPFAPAFVRYFNALTFNGPVAQGDTSPEGLLFVKAEESPTGKPLLIVSHEISGTITIHEVAKTP
jgi:hypothetical protein